MNKREFKKLLKIEPRKARRLDLSCLDQKVNTFEIRDQDNNLICNSCEEYQGANYSLKEGQIASFYFVGMQESMYIKGSNKPIISNITGSPSFEIIEYLYKKKNMPINQIFTLYLRMCEDCINELEAYVKGEKFERKSLTECVFCKEV